MPAIDADEGPTPEQPDLGRIRDGRQLAGFRAPLRERGGAPPSRERPAGARARPAA